MKSNKKPQKILFFLIVIVIAIVSSFVFFKKYSIPEIDLPNPEIDTPSTPGQRPDTNTDAQLTIVKIDSGNYKIDVANNTDPKIISEWFESKNIDSIINGTYFEEDFSPSAYLVVNKERVGEGYLGDHFTAYLTIFDNNNVTITEKQPTGTSIKHMVQGYPHLIKNGEQHLTSSVEQYSLRSAVGIDSQGDIYFIVSNEDHTLLEFTEELMKLDINFREVLNFDGGPSSGLYSKIENQEEQLDSILEVPNIIYANKK